MRFTRRAVPLALTIGLAVAGVVYLGGMRRPTTYEAVQLWTWTTAPSGVATPYLEALAGPALRSAIADAWLGRAPDVGEVDAVRGWLAARADPAGIHIVVRGASSDEAAERSAAVAEVFAAWSIEHDRQRREAELVAAQARVEDVTERVRAAQVLGPAADGDVAELLRERDAAVGFRDAALAALATGPTAPLEARPEVVRTRPVTAVRDAVLAGTVAGLLGLAAGLRGAGSGAPGAPRRTTPRRAAPERGRSRGAGSLDAPDALAHFPAAASDDAPALRPPAEALARAVVALDVPPPVVVLVVSLAAGAGKTTVACHLAEELARSGLRTLLVDASLWSPALATRYALDEVPAGATRIATTLDWMQRPLADHQVVGIDLGDGQRLDLVPLFRATRPAPGTAAALFGAFGDALGRWRGYDVVVADTAALDAVVDTIHLAPFATAAVVVVDRKVDGRRHRDEVRRRLRAANVPILGFVLDEPRASAGVG